MAETQAAKAWRGQSKHGTGGLTMELKSCPFCGGDGSLNTNVAAKIVFGSCWVCGARGPAVVSKDRITEEDITKAIEEWNRRADDEY
jgi:Lar family restriction alleviation protein